MKRKAMSKKLEKMLSKKRMQHINGVVLTAINLAKKYGVSEKKCETAALLHDCGKVYTEIELREKAVEYNFDITEEMNQIPDVLHAFVGALIAKNEYEIEDETILNAIRYHTTGRAHMSMIEKIIFIADCIEPKRQVYEGLDELRIIAYENIDAAMYMALSMKNKYVSSRNLLVHSLNGQALDYFKTSINKETNNG